MAKLLQARGKPQGGWQIGGCEASLISTVQRHRHTPLRRSVPQGAFSEKFGGE